MSWTIKDTQDLRPFYAQEYLLRPMFFLKIFLCLGQYFF